MIHQPNKDRTTTPPMKIPHVPNHDIVSNIVSKLSASICDQLDDSFIEGLRLKGFEFKTKFELECFIKDRCRCEDNTELKERIYYIDNTPFFLHKYETEMNISPIVDDGKTTMKATFGSFSYL